MIGYTCVGTNDLDKAVAFYSDLLGVLGAKVFFKSDRGVGWGTEPDQPMFSVMKPFDGQPASPCRGLWALHLDGLCQTGSHQQ